MKSSGAIMLLIFVLLIAFVYWYFIFRAPCMPITKCTIPPINKTCTSNNECSFGAIHGLCDMNTFRCTNFIFEGNKEDCLKVGGIWYQGGCKG